MLRSVRQFLFVALILVVLLAACAPRGIPATGASLTPEAATLSVPDSPEAAGVLDSVLPGPPAMRLGSAYRYFDGSLLDAVPNDGPVTLGGGLDESLRQVTVSDFWIYSTEVSNQMYAWCVALGKCSPPDRGDNPGYGNVQFANYPVVGVNWQQAADYCGFAHGQLPTEAQWEKAAAWDASLKEQRAYPWGTDNPSCDLLNFKYCIGRAVPVLQFGQGRSAYGVFNMEGNVAEWAADWYQPGYAAGGQDPQGPTHGTLRSIRGSAYDSDAMFAAPWRRFSASPTAHRPTLGFRCVVKDPAYFAPFCVMPVSYGIDPTGANAGNPCPDPTIRHEQTCGVDSKVHNFITVENSGSTVVQVTGLESCTPGVNDTGKRHDCGAGVTVNVTASCQAAVPGSVSCPPNYRQDPQDPLRCTAPGAPGSCPAGFQYDSTLQCCSAANSDASVPLCSVGQHLYNGACVYDGSGLLQPRSLSFTTSADVSCIPGSFNPNPGGSAQAATLVPFPTWTPAPPAATPIPPTDTQQPPTPVPTDVPTNAPTATEPPPLPTLPPDTPVP